MNKRTCLTVGAIIGVSAVVGLPMVAMADTGTVAGSSNSSSTSTSTQSATTATSASRGSSTASGDPVATNLNTTKPTTPQSTPATPVTGSPAAPTRPIVANPGHEETYPKPRLFDPYTVSQDWYKAGGTTDNIWPQSTTPISCGGIVQHDVYTITSGVMAADYSKLIAGGVLNGPSGDAEFNPHEYTVVVLPACDVPVAVVAAPYVVAKCFPGSTYQTNTMFTPVNEHVTWKTDEGMGSQGAEAIADAGYVLTGQSVWQFPRETSVKCPVVTVPPVVVPPVVTPPVTPVPPVTAPPAPSGPSTPPVAPIAVSSPVPTPGISVTPKPSSKLSASLVTSPPTSSALAFTGSSDVKPALIGAVALFVAGCVLVVVGRIRRKKNA